MSKDKYNVFISYSRNDYKNANNEPKQGNVISKITSAFRNNNITYWIDEDGIYTGDNFAPKIAEAIKDSSVFVFVSTENSNKSPWTQNEISVAQLYKKPILPIRCDDSTYATNVVMYLAMLDYCDYKNFPDSAIEQLVNSVKDKLPHDVTQKNNLQIGKDEKFKETIVNSIAEINHQFVDISQIAVSKVLEANEKMCYSVNEFRNLFMRRSDITETQLQCIREDIHSFWDYLIKSSKENTSQICIRLEKCIERIEETKQSLEKVCNLMESQLKPQKKNHNSKLIANLIFIIDVSGSMEGARIDILNTIMNRFTSRFDELYVLNCDITFKLSVLSFSSSAEWMYNNAKDVVGFEWKRLEASGLTNFGLALNELNKRLSFENGILSNKNDTFAPLIIFFSDGSPTDDWNNSLSMIKQNKIFDKSYKRVIAIGEDAPTDILSQLSFQGIIKTRGDFDMEYAISDIVSGYINELSSNMTPLLNQLIL